MGAGLSGESVLGAAAAAGGPASFGGLGAQVSGGASYAYQLLRYAHAFSEDNQFFFAKACLELGRFAEAEEVLHANAVQNPNPSVTKSAAAAALVQRVPDVLPPRGSQGLLLLGQLCHASSRLDEAAAWFHRCLRADPLCWSAYAALCHMGVLERSTLNSADGDSDPMAFFRVDAAELAQAFRAQESTTISTPAAEPHQSPVGATTTALEPFPTSPRRPARDHDAFLARFKDTPASAVVPHLHMLSLSSAATTAATPATAAPASTVAPHRQLFATPATSSAAADTTRTATAAKPTSKAAPASPFVTPPPAGTPRGSPLRGGGGGRGAAFSSPPQTAAKTRAPARGHMRAQSASSISLALAGSPVAASPPAASSAAAASAVPGTAVRRKLAGRLLWGAGGGGASSGVSGGSDLSGDDGPSFGVGAGGLSSSERERNEKKVGRRITRIANAATTATPGEKQAKTPRLGASDAPTTPRRAAAGAAAAASSSSAASTAPMTARKTPATRRTAGSSAAAAAAGAPSKQHRLPEITEAATPESQQSDQSVGANNPLSPPAFGAAGAGGGEGRNLLTALATPSMFATPASPHARGRGPASSRSHMRSRSHSALPGLPDAPGHHFLPGASSGDDMMDDDADAEEGDDENLEGTGAADELGLHGEDEDDEADERAAAAAAAAAETQLLDAAAVYLTTLLQTFAEGYRLQHLYSCSECVSVLETLPPHHGASSLSLRVRARALFEAHQYEACMALYSELRRPDRRQPGREDLRGMEYFSTALWQRGSARELSLLAHELLGQDARAGESWLVLGNSFSLQGEHELALKFFRRAIQCAPGLAYAYTLSAHEYTSSEESERAQTGYRLAIHLDPRAYAAWYGLGNLYLRQEKLSLALSHFRRALRLHPGSSVLHCFQGLALQAARRLPEALDSFVRAEQLDAHNALAKFHLASVLVAQGRWDDALVRLQLLAELVPREANVHLLLGKVLKRLGQTEQALQRFVTALELEPTDRSAIKAAIENVHTAEGDEAGEDNLDF
jgi:tetratricopeptide (TPR) repeat protein